jgi:hypothetical protein
MLTLHHLVAGSPISMNAPRASRWQRQQMKLSIVVIPVSGSRFPLGILSPSRVNRDFSERLTKNETSNAPALTRLHNLQSPVENLKSELSLFP